MLKYLKRLHILITFENSLISVATKKSFLHIFLVVDKATRWTSMEKKPIYESASKSPLARKQAIGYS